MRIKFWLVCWYCLSLALSAPAQDLAALQQRLSSYDAAFAVNDLGSGAFLRINETRCQTQFPPFATVEIPLALSALENKVARDLNTLVPWNRLRFPGRDTDSLEMSHWSEDHTMRSAFAHSVEWYWIEMAERLGTKRLRQSLQRLSFGNQQMPADFGLIAQDSALKISAFEQAALLQRLVQASVPMPATTQRQLKELLLRENGNGYQFFMKTGCGLLADGSYLGWSIGWLEAENNQWVFALNLSHKDLQTIQDATLQLPKQLLTDAGYWPRH